MEKSHYIDISVAGTILLGIVANIGVLVSALVWEVQTSALLAMASMGLAYVSQSCATAAHSIKSDAVFRIAFGCQVAAAISWVVGLILLF